MNKILPAVLRKPMKFHSKTWDKYQIKIDHNADNIRRLPLCGWIPYFWDTEAVFDMGIGASAATKGDGELWRYTWELRDLDNNVVKQDSGEIRTAFKGIRGKLAYWNYTKRAIVLGNLRPHREYLLYVKFITDIKQSDELLLASFTIEDRGQRQMEAFFIIFSIFVALLFTALAKGCGL